MKSIVLMDCEKFDALGTFRTFEKGADKTSFRKQNCAFKFLVIDDLLVIGPISDHSQLYAVHSLWNQPIGDETKSQVSEIAREQWSRKNYSVRGAGMISGDGRITDWKSTCFHVETPIGMRSEIEKAVTELFQAGRLDPQ